jgi:hypothetical protein
MTHPAFASLARLVVLSTLLSTAAPSTAAAPRQVAVSTTRVRVSDVMPGADPAIAQLDLGPAPVVGASRMVTRGEIVAALDAKQLPAPPALPEAVRVVRKAKHLSPEEVDALVRGALAAKPRRGVSVDAVRQEHAVDVADGWTHVDVTVPRAPKKAGAFSTTVIVSFLNEDREPLGRLAVPVALSVSADGALFDVSRGSTVTLVIRRSLVEVRVPAAANADADIGDPLPVQIRLSGRVVRARLVAKDEALAVEEPR